MKMNVPNKYLPLAIFITLALVVTVIAFSIAAVAKQSYRSNADDPQVEAVEEITAFVNQGTPLEAVIDTTRSTDIAKSLATFIIVFDNNKKMLAGSGALNEEVPTPPEGVFDIAKQSGEHRFTWEPQPGVRIAAVLSPVDNDGGYVLAGRSLREVEARANDITNKLGFSWIILLVLSGLLTWLVTKPQNSDTDTEESGDQSNDEPDNSTLNQIKDSAVVVEEKITIEASSDNSQSN